jgi:hypothetical protein
MKNVNLASEPNPRAHRDTPNTSNMKNDARRAKNRLSPLLNERASPTSSFFPSRPPSNNSSQKDLHEFMAFDMEDIEGSAQPVYVQAAPRNYRSSRDEEESTMKHVEDHLTNKKGQGNDALSDMLEASKQALEECANFDGTFEENTFDFANLALTEGGGDTNTNAAGQGQLLLGENAQLPLSLQVDVLCSNSTLRLRRSLHNSGRISSTSPSKMEASQLPPKEINYENPMITTIESYSTTSRFLEVGRGERRSVDSEAALERQAGLVADDEVRNGKRQGIINDNVTTNIRLPSILPHTGQGVGRG